MSEKPGVVKSFVTTVVPAVLKPLRVLWNEIIGFFFLVVGAIMAISLFRRARDFDGNFSGLLNLSLAGLFVAMLIGYGLYSFLRARKISKS